MYNQLLRTGFNKFIDQTFKGKESVHRYLKTHPGINKMVEGLEKELHDAKSRNLALDLETIKQIAEDYARVFCTAALNNKEGELRAKFSRPTDFDGDENTLKVIAKEDEKTELKDKEWQNNLIRMDKRIIKETGRITKGYEK